MHNSLKLMFKGLSQIIDTIPDHGLKSKLPLGEGTEVGEHGGLEGGVDEHGGADLDMDAMQNADHGDPLGDHPKAKRALFMKHMKKG